MTRKQSDPNCGTVYKTSKEKSNWCALLDTGGMQFMMADWNLEGWGKTAINILRLLGKCDHPLCWNGNVTVSMSSSWGIMMLLALTSFKEDTCCNMYSTIIYSSPYSETILICFCEERERRTGRETRRLTKRDRAQIWQNISAKGGIQVAE